MQDKNLYELSLENKVAVVTGGAGFVGMNLVEKLLEHGYMIYMAVRPNSEHNKRIPVTEKIVVVDADLDNIENLSKIEYSVRPHLFFHLAWQGAHNDFDAQYKNIDYTLRTLKVAKSIGCKRFICTGSQAEYGIYNELIHEELVPKPITAYGSAKVAACYMSKNLAKQLDIEWVWGRIFSVYGKYEPETTLISYLKKCFENGEVPVLTKCTQNWDYLHSSDAAEAIIAMGEKGVDGEIYNIANGNYKQLNLFVEDVRNCFKDSVNVKYEKEVPYIVTLAPAIDKLKRDTEWEPKAIFSRMVGE